MQTTQPIPRASVSIGPCEEGVHAVRRPNGLHRRLRLVLVLLWIGILWAATTLIAQAQTGPQMLPQVIVPQVTTAQASTPQVSVTSQTALTARDNGFGMEYAVPSGPRNLIDDSAGRIWFTSPDADGVGVVTLKAGVTDPLVQYQVEFYSFAIGSEPYDIDFGAGAVWFSLHGANALGRIDINTRDVTFFSLPSADADPTGIEFGNDGHVWIAFNNSRIASFNPVTLTFFEYIFPDTLSATPEVEDIVYQNSRAIWFTMPTANVVGIYNSVTDRFFTVPTGEIGPYGLTLDVNGRPWVTTIDSSRVGRYNPTTVSSWIWYNTPTRNSRPAKVIVFDSTDRREVWVTESAVGSVGRIQLLNGFEVVKREAVQLATPAGEPWGIILTPDQHIWVADSGRNMLFELSPPYIYNLYLSFMALTSETPAIEAPAIETPAIQAPALDPLVQP